MGRKVCGKHPERISYFPFRKRERMMITLNCSLIRLKTDVRSFLSEEKMFYQRKCHARVSTSINSFKFSDIFFRSKDTSKVLIV